MTVTDRTDATEQEFRSRIAAFESAPTPPEVREAAVLEEVARAIFAADAFPGPAWEDDAEGNREDYRRLAAAAVAAYRAQGGRADLATALADQGLRSCCGQPSAEHCR